MVGALRMHWSGFRCQAQNHKYLQSNLSRDSWGTTSRKHSTQEGERQRERRVRQYTLTLLFLVGVCDCSWRKVKLPREWCGPGLVIR